MRKEERTLDFSLNKILIPRELVLKILCEALITVAHDQKGEPDRWGDRTLPSAFSMKLAPLDEPQHPTPVGVRDGLKDLAASARVACVCKALRELTQGELFEEMLQRLEEDFEKGSPKPEQTEGGGLARADHGLPQIDLKSTQEYTQYVMKRGPKPPHLQYFDADGSLKFEYRQFIDPRHREDWATTTTSGKYRLLLEHVDRCCKRLYTVLSDEAGVEYVTNSLVGDSDWRMVVTPPFVRRLLYNCFSDYLREGTTEGIDYWDLLVGGWFNFPYSDTMNREIVWESFEDEIGPDW
jgi:hypothetical protein